MRRHYLLAVGILIVPCFLFAQEEGNKVFFETLRRISASSCTRPT